MNKSEGLLKFDYESTGNIHGNNRGWNIAMYKKFLVPNREIIYKFSSNSEERRLKQSIEKKNLSWMMVLVGTFDNHS